MTFMVDLVPDKAVNVLSHLKIVTCCFCNFRSGCVYSETNVNIQALSSIFEFNSNFVQGACMEIKNARKVSVEKCFANSCQTNYNGTENVWILGQFGYFRTLRGSENNVFFGLSSFTSCAPDYDRHQKRRSTIECLSFKIVFTGLNFSYNNLFVQVILSNGETNLSDITFYRNTVEYYIQEELAYLHTNKHIQYVENTVSDISKQIVMYVSNRAVMTECVFQNMGGLSFDVEEGATIQILNSWFDVAVLEIPGLTIEETLIGDQPTSLAHFEIRSIFKEMRNQRKSNRGRWEKLRLVISVALSILKFLF